MIIVAVEVGRHHSDYERQRESHVVHPPPIQTREDSVILEELVLSQLLGKFLESSVKARVVHLHRIECVSRGVDALKDVARLVFRDGPEISNDNLVLEERALGVLL